MTAELQSSQSNGTVAGYARSALDNILKYNGIGRNLIKFINVLFVYGPHAWALGTFGPTFVYGPHAWALGTLGPLYSLYSFMDPMHGPLGPLDHSIFKKHEVSNQRSLREAFVLHFLTYDWIV